MTTRIALFLLCAASVFAQSGLEPPAVGHYRDDAGRMIRIQGLPGALTVKEVDGVEESLADGWQIVREEGRAPELLRVTTGERFAIPRAAGNLTLFVRWPDGTEQAAGNTFEFPPAAPGETQDIAFRIRNTGDAGAVIERLTISGKGFRIPDAFSPPRTVAPGLAVAFTVRFAPEVLGTHTAKLQINDTIYDLVASASPQVTVEIQSNGTWLRLSPYTPTNLGSVEAGKVLSTPLRILPPDVFTAPPIPSVSGTGFRLFASGLDYSIVFEPPTVGPYPAVLTVGERTYPLTATATSAPPPTPILSLRTTSMESGRQEFLSIRLSEVARAAATGQLRLEFIPATATLGDDASIVFLPAKNRSAAFTVAAGATEAMFQDSPQLVLQTGATAGTIVLRMTLGTHSEETRITVDGVAVRFDSAKASRGSNIIEINLAGLDNTHSVGTLGFRFYLTDGTPVGGLIEVDAGESFRKYYAANPDAAGTFSLRASFLVSGPINLLDSVDVTVKNANGLTSTGRLRF